jgi:hypothetical protein
MQNTGFRHSTSEYEDVNQSTVRAAEIGAYPRSNKRSSMVQQPVVTNPLPPLPNKSPSSRSISTVASRNFSNNDTAFLEMILPMLDKVRFYFYLFLIIIVLIFVLYLAPEKLQKS